jgi:hypothetical protein
VGAILSPTCAEKPGCFQARSLFTSSGEMAWARTSLASRRSRKRLISRVAFHSGRGCQEPSAVFPPSVVSRWPRDGEDEVAVRDLGEHLRAQPLGPQELPFLLA